MHKGTLAVFHECCISLEREFEICILVFCVVYRRKIAQQSQGKGFFTFDVYYQINQILTTKYSRQAKQNKIIIIRNGLLKQSTVISEHHAQFQLPSISFLILGYIG